MKKATTCLALAAAAFSGVAANPKLPESCSWKGGNSVVCRFDGFSEEYVPVIAAVELAQIPKITDLLFQINIANGKGQTPITDEQLITIGQSLNSTSLTSLALIVGSLRKVTGDGISKFTALNPIAQNSLTSLSLDVQINPVSDANAATIGENLAKFSSLKTASVNVKNMMACPDHRCHPTMTGNGLAAIVGGLKDLSKVQTLSLIAASAPFASFDSAKAIGDGLANMKALKSLHLEIPNSGLTDKDYMGVFQGVATLSNLEQLYLNVQGNKLSGSSLLSTTRGINAFKKLASLTTDFGEYNGAETGNNTISISGVQSAVKVLNQANYQGQWALSLENSLASTDIKAYAEALACLKNPKILKGSVPLSLTSVSNPMFSKDTEVSAKLGECSTGLALDTDVTGGPFNDHTHVCVTCQ